MVMTVLMILVVMAVLNGNDRVSGVNGDASANGDDSANGDGSVSGVNGDDCVSGNGDDSVNGVNNIDSVSDGGKWRVVSVCKTSSNCLSVYLCDCLYDRMCVLLICKQICLPLPYLWLFALISTCFICLFPCLSASLFLCLFV